MKKKVVIIEDNPEVRENIEEILTLAGYDVSLASDGKEGVKVIKEKKPDLILCDVMMPNLDGFGVRKILNFIPELMHTPFIFLTAKNEYDDFRKGMGLGADDYITKPFDETDLLEAIEIRLKKNEDVTYVKPLGPKSFIDESKGEEIIKTFIENREYRKYHKKDVIYEREYFPKWMFYVESGKVKTFLTNDLGKDLITNIYKEGEFFGFLPILAGHKYDDTAVAVEESIIKIIPAEDFKTLLYNDRDFAAKFIKMLASHADHSEKQLINLAYSSVRKKVANALLTTFNDTMGKKMKIRRDDLAALSGTAKETTIRTLSDFKYEGLIDIEKGRIIILQPEKLKNMPE